MTHHLWSLVHLHTCLNWRIRRTLTIILSSEILIRKIPIQCSMFNDQCVVWFGFLFFSSFSHQFSFRIYWMWTCIVHVLCGIYRLHNLFNGVNLVAQKTKIKKHTDTYTIRNSKAREQEQEQEHERECKPAKYIKHNTTQQSRVQRIECDIKCNRPIHTKQCAWAHAHAHSEIGYLKNYKWQCRKIRSSIFFFISGVAISDV